jgi:hypothetical protein
VCCVLLQAADLCRLMCMYNEWAFQLFPGMNRDDLFDTVGKMGSRPAIKAYMGGLRDAERDRYIVEDLKLELPTASSSMGSPAFLTSPEDNTPGPGPPSEAHTPGNADTHNASSLEFDEACFLALEAAMTKKKEAPAAAAAAAAAGSGSVEGGTENKQLNDLDSDAVGVGSNAAVTDISSAVTDISSAVGVADKIAKTGNDLVVELSDEEEMELNFDDFDNL